MVKKSNKVTGHQLELHGEFKNTVCHEHFHSVLLPEPVYIAKIWVSSVCRMIFFFFFLHLNIERRICCKKKKKAEEEELILRTLGQNVKTTCDPNETKGSPPRLQNLLR